MSMVTVQERSDPYEIIAKTKTTYIYFIGRFRDRSKTKHERQTSALTTSYQSEWGKHDQLNA